jgi:catechol 2,3-dioxygenase-like lactoylglutathione lyase family enzyme
MQLTGIQHLTAISVKPRQNLAFYAGLLSMSLVKKTVNQDDVSADPFVLRRWQNQSRYRLLSAIAKPSRCRD